MSEAQCAIVTLSSHDDLSAWDEFVGISPQGSVFCRSFWLKAATGNSFTLLTLQRGGRIVAGMPLPIRVDRLGRRAITMPLLTQTLGVLLSPSKKMTYEGRLSEEVETTSLLVRHLPDVPYFSQVFNYNFNNWTPFYWDGYQQTTYYTYVLRGISDIDTVVANFDHSKRKNLRKAAGLVEVREDMTAGELYSHQEMTLGKQGKRPYYSRDYLVRLADAAQANNAGKTFYAIDKSDKIHAAILIVHDQRSAYYLVSSIDPELSSSGAVTLLIKNAIEFSSKRSSRFDFEGSMIPGVERSFRQFGGELMPYYRIWRDRRVVAERLLQKLWVSTNSLLYRRILPFSGRA